MPKKLIEVALPLRDISDASAQEKSVRSGQLSNLHPWWARRPLAAARSVLFAQLVDDPSGHPERFPADEDVLKERSRLFELIRRLCDPNGPDEATLRDAKIEIERSSSGNVLIADPFAGGGAIPVEAQRLGLTADASDLNPVAVLLNRVVLEMLPSVFDRPPVNPEARESLTNLGAKWSGLCDDLRYYGKLLRDLTEKQVAYLYPVVLSADDKTVEPIAWIWARAVECPNPACQLETPLTKSFMLSKKAGRECWVDPDVKAGDKKPTYRIRHGKKPRISETIGRTGASCISCGSAIPLSRIREEAQAGRLTIHLLAIAAQGDRRRVYVEASPEHALVSNHFTADPFGAELSFNPRDIKVPNYGMKTLASLFTPRQLETLQMFSAGINRISDIVMDDSERDAEYARVISTLLGLAVSKFSELSSALCPWEPTAECPRRLFGGQAIKMTWSFAEGYPLGRSSGSFLTVLDGIVKTIEGKLVGFDRDRPGVVSQQNAVTRTWSQNVVVSTDPPYFDNIAYADLSDFFYVWLRLGLHSQHPDLFQTLLTPKVDELVAVPYRFDGGQDQANEYFEAGFREVFSRIVEFHNPDIPMTLFYAYKQEDEEDEDGDSSGAGATGWERFLQGMVDTGLQITATWPMRTEMKHKVLLRKANALASSVVLSCRPRSSSAGITDRQGFVRHLRRELTEKLEELQSGGIQPVDVAQASIGPGMAVFTSYARVLDSGNHVMTVGTALQIINQILDEIQTERESEFDSDTRWAVTWFEQNGMNAGDFDEANRNATARGTAVNALERAGIIEARAGRVRLLNRNEYADDWDPTTDKRLTVWEVCQNLIRRIEGDGGLTSAAALLRLVGGHGEAARDLAYRLYEIANRNGWSEEARAYNNLAAEWPDLVALAAQAPSDPSTLF